MEATELKPVLVINYCFPHERPQCAQYEVFAEYEAGGGRTELGGERAARLIERLRERGGVYKVRKYMCKYT